MCIFKTIYSSLNYFRRKVNEVDEAEENEKRNDTEKLRKEKKKKIRYYMQACIISFEFLG